MSARPICAALAALALLANAACSEEAPIPDGPGACAEVTRDLPVEIRRSLDLLFVIDNSASMAEEQASLLATFPVFEDLMESIHDGPPNLHIGVVSTDLGAGPDTSAGCTPGGDGGRLQSTPRGDCQGPDDAYIIDIANRDGTRTRNYEGGLADALACIAALGTEGCEFEQPLEAMRRALDGSNPENDGFRREDAFLFVAFITDEDDCSASDAALFDPDQTDLGPLTSFRCFEYGVQCEPDLPRLAGVRSGCRPRASSPYVTHPDEYVSFLKELDADQWALGVGAAFGNPAPVAVGVDDEGNPLLVPSCESEAGSAAPGTRLAYFLDQFPQRSSSASVCSPDFGGALALLADIWVQVLGAPCVEGAIDLDPDMPGLQVDCTVSEVRFPYTDQQQETLLEPCLTVPPEPGTMPCWGFEVDPGLCVETETHAILNVYYGGADVAWGTHVIMRCSTGCVEL